MLTSLLAGEIEEQFMTEFAYNREAENLKEVGDNVMPVFGDHVYIPQPVQHLCTREVMVMDLVPGVRLVDGVMDQHRRYAKMMGTTLEELQDEHKRKLAQGELEMRSIEEEARRTAAAQRLIATVDTAKNAARFMCVVAGNSAWKATPEH